MSILSEKSAAVSLARKAYRGLVNVGLHSGLPELWRAVTGRRHLILKCHRVRPAGQPADPFDTCPSVSVACFRKVLEYVGERFTVLPLNEICGYAGKAPAIAITFDDGWRDSYDVAFPVLRELGIPATSFITTGKIGSSEPFWQQTLGEAFRHAGQDPGGHAARALRAVLEVKGSVPLTPSHYRQTVIRWKSLSSSRLDELLREAGCATLPAGRLRCFVTADEIREMAQAGIAFGSHTVTHPILPRERPATTEWELAQSKASLENLLGGTIDMLAYPDGQNSPEVYAIARSLGYRIGCTTNGWWLSSKDDHMCLPRLELTCDFCDGRCEAPDERQPMTLLAGHHRRAAKRHASRVGVGRQRRGRVAIGRGAATRAKASEKIRVLFLIDNVGGSEGGTEQHLLFLQRELPRDLLDLHFGVLTGLERIRAEDFPVRPVMLNGFAHGWRGGLARIRRLAAYIKTNEIDVVHAFGLASELQACLAVRLAGRGKVLGVRRNIGYCQTWRSRWIGRLVGLLGAQYAANCEAARDFAARVEWIGRRRVTVIRNPVQAKRIEEGLARVPPRSSLGIADGEQAVGIVATVRPVKDYATFLRAARLVLDDHPQTRFLVIGTEEPDYKAQMLQLVDELGIERHVAWLGSMPNPLCVVPLFHVAVLSSYSEAMSNAVIEYAAAGVATVATDVGGTREVVEDGQTGFLVPARDPQAMAKRISQLLADAELRRAMGEKARLRMRGLFSQRNVLMDYAALYARLAGHTPEENLSHDRINA